VERLTGFTRASQWLAPLLTGNDFATISPWPSGVVGGKNGPGCVFYNQLLAVVLFSLHNRHLFAWTSVRATTVDGTIEHRDRLLWPRRSRVK
jgi:hypothetical protein